MHMPSCWELGLLYVPCSLLQCIAAILVLFVVSLAGMEQSMESWMEGGWQEL